MAGVGDAWGTRESMLHPRDSHGRFRSKWKMSTAVVDKLMAFLGSYNPKTFGNDQEAGNYTQELGRSGRRGYGGNAALGKFLRDPSAIQAKLRSGDTSSPEVKAIDDSMTPLPDDLILTRVMGPEAFGLTPETMAQVEEYTGHLVADKGFTPTNIGTPLPHAGPAITMTIATPAGTKAAIPRSNGGREVILDRDQPLRITKVDPDGKGGFYVLAVAETKGAPGSKRTTKLGGAPPAPEPGLPQPQQTPGAPAAPGAPEAPVPAAPVAPAPGVLVPQKKIGRPAGPPPAVRNEGHVAESVGGKPVPQGATPEPTPGTPEVPGEPIPQQPDLPDKPAPDPRSTFRGAFKKADLNSPSEGKRRQQFNEAYLGAATGKKTPQEAVDALEHHIALNEKILQSDKEDGTDSGPLPGDIKKQKDLAQLIRDHFGLEGAKTEEKPTKAVKKVAPKTDLLRTPETHRTQLKKVAPKKAAKGDLIPGKDREGFKALASQAPLKEKATPIPTKVQTEKRPETIESPTANLTQAERDKLTEEGRSGFKAFADRDKINAEIDKEVKQGERERKTAIRKETRAKTATAPPREKSDEEKAFEVKRKAAQDAHEAQQAKEDAAHDAAAKVVADKWLADAGLKDSDLSDFEKVGLKLISSDVASKKISEAEGRRRLGGSSQGNLAKIGANAPAKRAASPKKAAGPLNDDLSNATIPQLREEAAKRGIKIPSAVRKKEDIRRHILAGKPEDKRSLLDQVKESRFRGEAEDILGSKERSQAELRQVARQLGLPASSKDSPEVLRERILDSKGKILSDAGPNPDIPQKKAPGSPKAPASKKAIPTWEELGKPKGPSPVGVPIGHEGGTYELLPGEPRRYRVVNADGKDISDQVMGTVAGRHQTAEDARTALRMDVGDRKRVQQAHDSGAVAVWDSIPGSWSYENAEAKGFQEATAKQRHEIRVALSRWTAHKSSTKDPTRQAEPTVNAALRGSVPMDADVKADIAALDLALDLSRTKKPITVHRGVTNGEHILPDNWENADLTGLEWSTKGYTPTTGNPEAAEAYVGDAKNRGFLMRIQLPKGSSAVAIRDAIGGGDDEGEVVLPRGLTFRVVKDNGPQGEFGLRSLDVEIVETKKVTPSVPEKAAGTAKGKLTASRVAPGTRILVRKDAKGEWAPTATKTGATPITVTSKDASTAGGRRGGVTRSASAGWVIAGKDDDGNEITVKPVTPSQTFWLHEKKETKAPEAKAPAKKVAAEAPPVPKAAPAVPMATRKRDAVASLRDLSEEFKATPSTSEKQGAIGSASDAVRNWADELAGGKISPQEATNRLNQLDRRLGHGGDAESKKVHAAIVKAIADIKPSITVKEIKVPKAIQDGVARTSINDLRDQAQLAGIKVPPSVKTKAQLMDFITQELAKKEAIRRGEVVDAPTPKAIKDNPYNPISVEDVINEAGLDAKLLNQYPTMLPRVQEKLNDGKTTPGSVSRDIISFLRGPSSPGYESALIRGVGQGDHTPAQEKEIKAQVAHLDAVAAEFRKLAEAVGKVKRSRKPAASTPAIKKAAPPAKKAPSTSIEAVTAKVEKAFEKANPTPAGPKMSDAPLIENQWGIPGGTINYHEDGDIGLTVGRLREEDKHLDVDGVPLANELGMIATQGVRGSLTSQQVADEIKAVAAKLPEGSAARRSVEQLAERLNAPARAPLPMPKSTPLALKNLMEDFSKIPLARREGTGKQSEMDKLQDMAERFARGDIRPSRLTLEMDQTLYNNRHESKEGKFEIDRAVRKAIDALEAKMRNDKEARRPRPA